jgi:hypothetical protein
LVATQSFGLLNESGILRLIDAGTNSPTDLQVRGNLLTPYDMRFLALLLSVALFFAAGSLQSRAQIGGNPGLSKESPQMMPWELRRIAFFQTVEAVQAHDAKAAEAYNAILTEFETHPLTRTPMENMDILGSYYIPREGTEKCFPVLVLNAVLGWYDALRFASDSGRQEIFQKEKFFVRAFAWGGPAGQRQSLAFIAGNPDKVKVLIEYGLALAERQRDTDRYDRLWPTAYGSERKAGIAVAPLPPSQWDRAWEQAKERVRSYYFVKPAPERLSYTAEVRRQSLADSLLFHDLVSAPGGVAMADELASPKATQRKIVSIQILEPYQGSQIGVERWTIGHEDNRVASYTVKLIPDGKGGTTFVVSKEN